RSASVDRVRIGHKEAQDSQNNFVIFVPLCGCSHATRSWEVLCRHSTPFPSAEYAFALTSHGLLRFSCSRGRCRPAISRSRFRITPHTHIGWPVLSVPWLSSVASSSTS